MSIKAQNHNDPWSIFTEMLWFLCSAFLRTKVEKTIHKLWAPPRWLWQSDTVTWSMTYMVMLITGKIPRMTSQTKVESGPKSLRSVSVGPGARLITMDIDTLWNGSVKSVTSSLFDVIEIGPMPNPAFWKGKGVMVVIDLNWLQMLSTRRKAFEAKCYACPHK